jgi:hypothetical protein
MDGTANAAEHFESITDGELIVTAVLIDPNPFDVFHDQKRDALGSYFGAVKLRDVRVIQARQNLRFTPEMAGCFFAPYSKSDEFESNSAIQLLVARQVHFAHAAAANV